MKWQGKPCSENTWVTITNFQKLNLNLYELHQACNSSKPSSFKPGGIDEGKLFKVYSSKKRKGINKLYVELILVEIKLGLVFVGVKLRLAN